MTEEKPEQTPREKIALLAAMSPEEFNRFMMWNFNRACNQSLPSKTTDGYSAMSPAISHPTENIEPGA